MQLNRPSTFLLIPILSLFAVLLSGRLLCTAGTARSVASTGGRAQNRLGEERMEAIVAPPSSADLPTDESVRFHISQITIGELAERFRFLERIARPYVDKEMPLNDINKLINPMNPSLMMSCSDAHRKPEWDSTRRM